MRPPVPTATSTGSRSSMLGTVKSHSSGRSTTLTSRPVHRSRIAAASAACAIVERDEGQPRVMRLGFAAADRRPRARPAAAWRSAAVAFAQHDHRLPRDAVEQRQAAQSQSGTRSAAMIVVRAIRSATTANWSPSTITSAHEAAAVVARRHRRAIGAGGAEHREVAGRERVDLAVHREGVAGLADRADDVGGHPLAGRRDRRRNRATRRTSPGARGRSSPRRRSRTAGRCRCASTRITRVSSTPALPAITRPGSNISGTSQPLRHARDHRAVFGGRGEHLAACRARRARRRDRRG